MAKNSNKKRYETRTEEIAQPIAQKYGVYIYDVDYTKEGPDDYYLTIYIDKEGGVTVDDCENVSRAVEVQLDAENLIQDPYTLCVSSPGLGRTLTKERHLKYSLGQKVEVGLYQPFALTGQKLLTGILEDFDEKTVTVKCEPPQLSNTKRKKLEKENGQSVPSEPVDRVFDRKDIAVIRLFLDL